MNPSEAHVWRIPLDGSVPTPPATPGELARAARFRFDRLKHEYLRSHAALRAILSTLTDSRLDFAVGEAGKPYLPNVPRLKFNLSHTRGMALVAVAFDIEIGVDVEAIRPLSNYNEIAERFFPPSEAIGIADEHEFFRRWTRIEAVVKARGVGIYASGMEVEGDWSIVEIDAGPGYAAAVALPHTGIAVETHDFGVDR